MNGHELANKKKLILNFFLANSLDIVISTIALSTNDFQKIGPFASTTIAGNEFYKAIILKLAVTALIIGGLAISSKNKKAHFVFEKTIKIGTNILLIILISNTVQVLPIMIENLSR